MTLKFSDLPQVVQRFYGDPQSAAVVRVAVQGREERYRVYHANGRCDVWEYVTQRGWVKKGPVSRGGVETKR